MIHQNIAITSREMLADESRRSTNRLLYGMDATECRGHRARRRLNLLRFGVDTAVRIDGPNGEAVLTRDQAVQRIRDLNGEDRRALRREQQRRLAAGLPQFSRG
ncbi:hypothetical protein [Novosphingobium sp.]|uniref:hypothetical protein n=1 Tax=Novosphingobium sp. TaxID=1874826 RepID=UPI0028AF94FA|nr:hypothetical protein [Novosphingobium sp.]